MQRVFVGIAAVCVVSSVAYAQEAPDKIAEDEFNKGNTAYNLGKWDDAIDHFTKAYEAMPLSEFLYNIAQSHRQAGHCKDALRFYKRFRSLKETDKQAPLSKQKRDEIDRFIKQLTECADKTDSTAETKPDSIDTPPKTTTTGSATTTSKPTTTTGAPTTTSKPTTTTTGSSTTTSTSKPTSTTTGSPPTTTAPKTTTTPTTTPLSAQTETTAVAPTTATPTVATATPADESVESQDESPNESSGHAAVLSARALMGIARLSSGNLHIPVQPSFGVVAGYPLPVGPIVLDLGVGFAYTPLPYQVMGEQHQGRLLGARAVASARYAMTPKLSLRGDLGAGVAMVGGLVMGNPIAADYSAQSYTLPSVRVGVAADYALTSNLGVTASPFGFAFSPGADGMYGSSLNEIDVLVGVAYSQ